MSFYRAASSINIHIKNIHITVLLPNTVCLDYFQLRADNEYIAPHNKHARLHSREVPSTYLYSFEHRAVSHPYPDWMGKYLSVSYNISVLHSSLITSGYVYYLIPGWKLTINFERWPGQGYIL